MSVELSMATAGSIIDESSPPCPNFFFDEHLLVDIGEAPGSHLYHGRLG